MKILENESLASHTTYRIGGTCAAMVFPRDEEDFEQLPETIGSKPFFILGNGSNVLFADTHFDAVFVNLTEWTGITSAETGLTAPLQIKSGTPLADIVDFIRDRNIGYYDFLAGIPGSMGGAVYMNAGAWGRSIGSFVQKIKLYDLSARSFKTLGKEDIHFYYRQHDFLSPAQIVTGVWLAADKQDEDIGLKIDNILRNRRERHPTEPSCGSVFKNLEDTPAARLIEMCGLKSRRIGDAQVAEKHANFIINLGHASFDDVMSLIRLVQKEVKDQCAVELEPEVRIVKSSEHPLFHRI